MKVEHQSETEVRVFSHRIGTVLLRRFSDDFDHGLYRDRPWHVVCFGKNFATIDECVAYLEDVESHWFDDEHLGRDAKNVFVEIEVKGVWIKVIQEPLDGRYNHFCSEGGFKRAIADFEALQSLPLRRQRIPQAGRRDRHPDDGTESADVAHFQRQTVLSADNRDSSKELQ